MPKSLMVTRFEKFNKDRVAKFKSKTSERCFLNRLGLVIGKKAPPIFFEKSRLSSDQETRIFYAIHYLKYRVHHELSIDKKNSLIYFHDTLRNRVIDANIGLVYQCMQKSPFGGEDKLSNGSYALLRAVENFDPWLGWRFSTYACRSILRSFFIPPPKYTCLNLSEPEVLQTEELARKNDEENEMLSRLRELLKRDRGGLTEREFTIISMRFGFDGGESEVLEQIGIQFGITKERVRQIQRRAEKKLRDALMETFGEVLEVV